MEFCLVREILNLNYHCPCTFIHHDDGKWAFVYLANNSSIVESNNSWDEVIIAKTWHLSFYFSSQFFVSVFVFRFSLFACGQRSLILCFVYSFVVLSYFFDSLIIMDDCFVFVLIWEYPAKKKKHKQTNEWMIERINHNALNRGLFLFI